jgi:hypothetical protein
MIEKVSLILSRQGPYDIQTVAAPTSLSSHFNASYKTTRAPVLEDGAAALRSQLRAKWIAAQANAPPSGQPLVLDGKQVDNGLGIIANTRLKVRLDGEFQRFRASAGVMATDSNWWRRRQAHRPWWHGPTWSWSAT